MKKLISIMLVLVLAAGTFAIAGCSNNENPSGDPGSDSSDQSSKLEKAKVISAERQAARMLERPAPTPKPR